MSNENFAIPGLQLPTADMHLARSKTVAPGSFLPLVEWPASRRMPVIELRYAAYPMDPIHVIAQNRVSTFTGSGGRRLGIWLPQDIAECDWLAETNVNGVQHTRTTFTVGRAANWEVPASGSTQVQTASDTSGEIIDVGTDTIWQGSSWSRRLTITDTNGAAVDLGAYGAWSQLRVVPGGTLLAVMTVTVVDGLVGVLDISLSAAVTASLPSGWAWWDVLLQRPDQSYDRTVPVRVFVGTGVTEHE